MPTVDKDVFDPATADAAATALELVATGLDQDPRAAIAFLDGRRLSSVLLTVVINYTPRNPKVDRAVRALLAEEYASGWTLHDVAERDLVMDSQGPALLDVVLLTHGRGLVVNVLRRAAATLRHAAGVATPVG
jgi:hypothetical protein